MIEPRKQTGRCACGNVRFEVVGEPSRVTACHCKECQRRTGSAFGVGCYYSAGDFKLTTGITKTFRRSSASGRWVTFQFCPECGTTVFWHAEAVPTLVGVAAGTFDDTDCIAPKRHVWASSAQKWITFPEGAEILQQSNLGSS